MTITKELDLNRFEFWGGAKNFAALLTYHEFKSLEFILEDIYQTPPSETDINDLFCFSQESICEWIGLDEETIWER